MLAFQLVNIFSLRIGNHVVLSWQCLKVDWLSFTLMITQITFGGIRGKMDMIQIKADGQQMETIMK